MTTIERLATEAELIHGESWADVLTIIGITAELRMEARQDNNAEGAYAFAANLWCLLWDIAKPHAYTSAAHSLREALRGISSDADLRVSLRRSLDARVGSLDLDNAIAAGIENLVHLELA